LVPSPPWPPHQWMCCLACLLPSDALTEWGVGWLFIYLWPARLNSNFPFATQSLPSSFLPFLPSFLPTNSRFFSLRAISPDSKAMVFFFQFASNKKKWNNCSFNFWTNFNGSDSQGL
jgi:hypothetical protein